MSATDFYDLSHEGVRMRLPRVTSILRIIDRSNALMGWATKLERTALQAALEEVLTDPSAPFNAQKVWDQMQAVLSGKRAWVRARDQALTIGHAAHAIIHWHTQKMLGQDPGPEPSGPDPALRAVVAWLDWVKEVRFEPQATERLVYCPQCAYAGTCDTIAKVEGSLTVIDYKVAKGVYDEHHLQVRAYQHAAAREGIQTTGGLILRLPKTAEDPEFEAVPAEPIPHLYFRAACLLWRWQRRMEHEEAGSTTMTACEVQA